MTEEWMIRVRRFRLLFATGLCLSLPVLLGGCLRLSGTKPPGPWHQAYQPIDDAASMAFIHEALDQATQSFGNPVFPVNEVILRRSRKSAAARRYRIGEHFSLTDCLDSTNGIFVIYIGVDPGHRNYYALLGHECAHLLNPFITDWYMEGLATVFSEQICEELGKDWGNWKKRFESSKREPYAASYRMMQKLQKAFPDAYCRIPHISVSNGKGGKWQKVNIDLWISSLPEARQTEALEIIRPHVSVLKKHRGKQYDFAVPIGLK